MFTKFHELLNDGQVLNLSIARCGGKLTVGVHPQSPGTDDEAQKHIVPLVLTGTLAELDAGFFSHISAPLGQASGLLSNMEEFSKSLKKAGAESKAAKELKAKADKMMGEAEEADKAGQTGEALAAYKKVLETDAGNTKAKAKVNELSGKTGQMDMFAAKPAASGPKPAVTEPAMPEPPADGPLSLPQQHQQKENEQTARQEPCGAHPVNDGPRQSMNDMFAELMGTTVKGEEARAEPAPLPEDKPAAIEPAAADIPANEWEQFREFQKFKASMNGTGNNR